MHPRLHLTLSLASLAALGPLAYDAFLPALPAVGREFGMSLPAAQSLLAVYLAALASAHLLAAWLANALGKRAVLIASALLFCAGSAVCALAAMPWEIQAGRIVQGLGAGGVAALLPLLLRSHSGLTLRLLNEGAIPVLAPAIAALCVLLASWRHAFWLAAAAGLLVLVLLAMAPAASHRAGDRFELAGPAGSLTFWRYAACHALCFGAMAACMAHLPVMVALDLGLGAGQIAVLLAAGVLAMLLQAFGTGQARHGRDPMSQRVTAGQAMMVFGANLIAGWNLLEKGIDPFYYLLGCWALLCTGFALCMTPLAAGALKAAGGHARAGLSLLQFVSHAAAAAAILLTARGNVEDAALIAFGSAALMVIAGGALLPLFIWGAAPKAP
ncbi:MFS transporter [Pseudoduganella sp. HUAS MS19]